MNPTFQPPKVPNEKNPLTAWLDYLVRWATSERVLQIRGFTVQQRADGKIFVPASIGPSSQSVSNTYQITSLSTDTSKDYFYAKLWNGTALSGPEVPIAKRIDFRESLTFETVDGASITHTYSDDNNRTSSDGVTTQNEICWPRFVVGAEVQATACQNFTPVNDNSGNPIPLIDLTERVWLKY